MLWLNRISNVNCADEGAGASGSDSDGKTPGRTAGGMAAILIVDKPLSTQYTLRSKYIIQLI